MAGRLESDEQIGTIQVGRWATIGELEVLLEPQQRAKRYKITIRPRQRFRTGKVRTIYPPNFGRKLTDGL